jgi:lipid A 3-O-deacylase
VIGVDVSHGWDYQLDDEPAINMVFERRWRPHGYEFWGLESDAIPYVGGSVGNVFDFAGGGAIFRLGQYIKNDYGPAHIQPSLSGLEASEPYKGFWWYLFAGVEGRAVLHNIFLDGNTFSDSPNVDRNLWVGDAQFGAAIAYGPYRIALTDVHRTKEFEGQQGSDHFAAINLSVHF